MSKHLEGQESLWATEEQDPNEPVECLGLTFENDHARRSYFLAELEKKLKDPEFRKAEGFPIGTDEDILSLSDPPYHTACPNPFISAFIPHVAEMACRASHEFREISQESINARRNESPKPRTSTVRLLRR